MSLGYAACIRRTSVTASSVALKSTDPRPSSQKTPPLPLPGGNAEKFVEELKKQANPTIDEAFFVKRFTSALASRK